MVVAGRVAPEPGRSHYPIPPGIEFVEMPHYASAAHAPALARSLRLALRRWDAALRDVDGAWVLGPQGLALPLALLALARGKRVVLGVRQDLPAYAGTPQPPRPPAPAPPGAGSSTRRRMCSTPASAAWRGSCPPSSSGRRSPPATPVAARSCR